MWRGDFIFEIAKPYWIFCLDNRVKFNDDKFFCDLFLRYLCDEVNCLRTPISSWCTHCFRILFRKTVLYCKISIKVRNGQMKRFPRANTCFTVNDNSTYTLRTIAAVLVWHHNGLLRPIRKEIKHLDKADHSIVMNRFLFLPRSVSVILDSTKRKIQTIRDSWIILVKTYKQLLISARSSVIMTQQ